MTDLKGLTGTYSIKSKATGRIYYGSTAVCLEARWRKHREQIASGKHHSPILRSVAAKYGADDLVFAIVELINADETTILAAEQRLIDSIWNDKSICMNVTRTTGDIPAWRAKELGLSRDAVSAPKADIGQRLRVPSTEDRPRAKPVKSVVFHQCQPGPIRVWRGSTLPNQ